MNHTYGFRDFYLREFIHGCEQCCSEVVIIMISLQTSRLQGLSDVA
jgi:hypothetical protein